MQTGGMRMCAYARVRKEVGVASMASTSMTKEARAWCAHPVRILKIWYGSTLCKELRVAQNLEVHLIICAVSPQHLQMRRYRLDRRTSMSQYKCY